MRHPGYALPLVVCLVIPALLEKPGSGWNDATTQATAPRSQFVIHGVSGTARHTHGGAPAQIGNARFLFANWGDKPRRVSVVAIEFLRGNKDCDHPPTKVESHPKSGGILLEDDNHRASALQVVVAAGATVNASVGFTSVPAYYVYCDRFAFRFHFQVDDEKVTVIDEVNVTRMEPLRHLDPDQSE